ncbi:histidinol dehydrogenase [Candidatus Methanoplasma termitum]|uniref:Histidinol dehydrogenase n=1 Tax=Candidatus Methanoplasma termitum TaxID=1577791 RepID=A0A0A7LF53_9ARCH|nr:histidinol dehydrogenase [Candidatus Methanoplasma termitum]AIZ56111.1 histidinol dehydrogenase [Candidatus Methanoplasma termitum]
MWKQVDESFWKENRESKVDEVTDTVQDIIDLVRFEGDKALIDLTLKFDKIVLEDLEVTRDEIEEAYETVDPILVDELENAAEFIQRFHELQIPQDLWLKEIEPGITLGVKSTPLERVGCYIPGGRASYPSTALMCIIAARVAGVEEVICCTPAPINPLTLVAMDIAGVDEIFKVGGAQAIAAMALGTESIEPVQKIVGPGNVYVTAAKTMLRKNVEIDFPAGPSEIGVLADETANAEFIAADLVAQCEHDPSSACLLVTTDPKLPAKVWKFIEEQTSKAQRKEIIVKALENSGYIVEKNMDIAVEIMNGIAPEHLSIQVKDPLDVLSKVTNAGSIFVGPYTPVAAGDYASGTNHVLPTAGHSSVVSGLNVAHFRKTSTVQIISQDGLATLAPTIMAIAKAEGLHAHSASVKIRERKKE